MKSQLEDTYRFRSVVIGTGGHIDHGKTALVLALTGTDTDRLPEEKSRGITIDLGFASLTLQDGSERAADISLVDVPGHHAFIHNMLAGAGGIEAVLLVVAADEGVKEQTKEHMEICGLLGVRHGVVAVTKSDRATPERIAQVRRDVQEATRHTFLETAPVISVSAHTGEGLDVLKRELLRLSLALPEHNTERVLRIPLDRAFSVPGFGTVMTGTLQNGSLRIGDSVELQPGARSLRVRNLQVHHQLVQYADAPTRVGVNIPGVEVGEVHRGDVLVQPGTVAPVLTVDVELSNLPDAPPLRHRSRVGIHAFTSEASATILLYEAAGGSDTGRQLARLRLSKPMLLIPGDHFVLRSPAQILGGGRVLDARPMARLRKAAAHEWLESVRRGSPDQQIVSRVDRRGTSGITISELVQETGLRPHVIRKLIEKHVTAKQLIGPEADHAHTDRLVGAKALLGAVEVVWKELSEKKTHSSSRAELLSRTKLKDWVFDLALKMLVQARPVRISGTQVYIEEGKSATQPQKDMLANVEGLYLTAGLASPLTPEVASALKITPKELPPLITLLLRSGRLVRLGSDNLMVHAEALSKLTKELSNYKGETFDVGRFKELTGLTRKHAIPLLEYLDRARVTANRQGIRTVL